MTLVYDVLSQAVKACPAELLTEILKNVLEPAYRTKVLYRSRGSEAQKQIQEMINLGSELLTIVKTNPRLSELNVMAVLQRFIEEQAVFNEEKQTWKAKTNKDITANSLQSAHDPDVTYRKKGAKKHVGL